MTYKYIIGTDEVPCPVCDAAARKPCTKIDHPTMWVGMRWHAQRVFDASDATRAINALLGGDDG